jgi:hypothetical protein
MTRFLAIAFLALLAVPVAAQDMDPLFKSACEWRYDRPCTYRPVRQRRRVPHRVRASDYLVPIPRREAEVRDWRREWERRGRDRYLDVDLMARCSLKRYEGASDEKLVRDAEAQAETRWSAIVRVYEGELFIDWKNATDRRVRCFQSSPAGERATDKMTGAVKGAVRAVGDAITGREREDGETPSGSHIRCTLSARPCRAAAVEVPTTAPPPPPPPPREWRR